MLRVLMPSWSLPPNVIGGMDVYVWELASRLKCRVIIPVPIYNLSPGLSVPDNIKIIPIDIGKPSSDLFENIKLFNNVVFASIKDFDLIHANDWLFAPLALRYKKELGKRFILSVHSLEYMRAVNPSEKNTNIERIEKEMFKEADSIITVSNFMKKSLSFLEKEIEVIYNGGPKNTQMKHKHSKNILFVGRLSKQKGVEHLLLAAKEVISHSTDVRFTIVGSGFMKKKLEYLAGVLGIKDYINFTGFIPSDKIDQLYQSADIFVAPSVYEPFGLVILEAMSFGIPVITTKDTGASEQFIDGTDLLLINDHSSTELASKILLLLEDENLRKKLSSNAAEKLNTVFSWDRCAKETLEVYNKTPFTP